MVADHRDSEAVSSLAIPIRLRASDAERYARLRRRMLVAAPWAFAASPEDDRALDMAELAAYLDDERKALFAIEQARRAAIPALSEEITIGSELVAAAGIVRVSSPKSAHRAKIWGVFVEPEYRSRGFGRMVVGAAIAAAKRWPGVEFVDLAVSENSPEAQRLYESFGFEAWGREPEAIDCSGQRYDEIYMTLRLSPAAVPRS